MRHVHNRTIDRVAGDKYCNVASVSQESGVAAEQRVPSSVGRMFDWREEGDGEHGKRSTAGGGESTTAITPRSRNTAAKQTAAVADDRVPVPLDTLHSGESQHAWHA